MTEKELLATERKEHDKSLEAVTAILGLLSKYSNNVTNDFHAWYRKYSKNGIVTYADSHRYLTQKELRTFNRKYGTSFKRLRRDNALFMLYSFRTKSFLSDYVAKMHDLGVTIVGYEAGLLKFDLNSEEVLATKWGQDSTTYDERIKGKHNKLLYDLTTATKRGIARSEQPESISMDLVDVVQSLKRNISSLVLTEATAIASLAKRVAYKAISPNKHFKNVEVMDERTCPICAAINGKIFPMKAFEVGVTAPPYHPRCRGTTKIVD